MRRAEAEEGDRTEETEEVDDSDESEDEPCVPCEVPDVAVPLAAEVELAGACEFSEAVFELVDPVAFALAGVNTPFAGVAVEAGDEADEADVAGTLAAPVSAGVVLEQLTAGVGVTAA